MEIKLKCDVIMRLFQIQYLEFYYNARDMELAFGQHNIN